MNLANFHYNAMAWKLNRKLFASNCSFYNENMTLITKIESIENFLFWRRAGLLRTYNLIIKYIEAFNPQLLERLANDYIFKVLLFTKNQCWDHLKWICLRNFVSFWSSFWSNIFWSPLINVQMNFLIVLSSIEG